MQIGKNIQQPQWFKAFIPDTFPVKWGFNFSPHIIQKANQATLLLWKLDGITQLLPDVDFFILMYIRKDATSSSQIEWTKATMSDVIEAEAKTSSNLPDDVDDIFHYIDAVDYGIKRLEDFPMSLRVITEIHKILMESGRASHFADPWHFRSSQNWIWWTKPSDASYVPPPVHEMQRSLKDLEEFFHNKNSILPILRAWLIHAQFETIHPFLDWNGRTWRILITLYLWLEEILEKPVLFLSSFFHKHKKTYYEKLDRYHADNVEDWLDFFLEWIIVTAKEAIETVKEINNLREVDMKKISQMSKASSESTMNILMELFKVPIVNVANIEKWGWYTTRQWAQKSIDRLVEMWILEVREKETNYGKSYIYKKYYDIFTKK